MSVERLTKRALQKILAGVVNEEATCVIKFYSNTCHFCHNLQPIYEEISENYEDRKKIEEIPWKRRIGFVAISPSEFDQLRANLY